MLSMHHASTCGGVLAPDPTPGLQNRRSLMFILRATFCRKQNIESSSKSQQYKSSVSVHWRAHHAKQQVHAESPVGLSEQSSETTFCKETVVFLRKHISSFCRIFRVCRHYDLLLAMIYGHSCGQTTQKLQNSRLIKRLCLIYHVHLVAAYDMKLTRTLDGQWGTHWLTDHQNKEWLAAVRAPWAVSCCVSLRRGAEGARWSESAYAQLGRYNIKDLAILATHSAAQ